MVHVCLWADLVSALFYKMDCIMLIFILVMLILMLVVLRLKPPCCNSSKKEVLQDIQRIIWSDSKNIDSVLNILIGIGSYFNSECVFYAVADSDDEISIITPNKEIPEWLNNICRKAISKKSPIDRYKIGKKSYISYALRLENYNVGVIVIGISDRRLSEGDLQVLDSFSEFVCLKHRAEILEEALCKSEMDLETIMNNTTDGLVFTDRLGIIKRTNKAAVNFSSSFKSLIGKHIGDAFKSINEDVTCSLTELINIAIEKKIPTETRRTILITGNKIDISTDVKTAPIFNLTDSHDVEGVMIFLMDAEAERKAQQEKEKHFLEKEKHYLELHSEVQQRKEVEKALIRSAALASAGTLAAGVAHEYNNINSIAMGNLDVLIKMKALPIFVLDSLKTIRHMNARGAEITRSLLDYAKGGANGDNKRKVVSLVDLVESTKKLVDKEFSKEGILFSSNFDDLDEDKDSYLVLVNTSQIKQAILNIVLNARHAMSDRPKKLVSFEVGSDHKDVYLKISDTGHGIPEEDIDKLFAPFFTTKGRFAKEDSQKKFKGNGLGLAITHMIIKEHGGSISVSSKVGIGTELTIKMSKIDKKESDEDSLSEEEIDFDNEIEIRDGRNMRILVLDDEKELCKLLVNILVGNGYKAEYTDDGNEALVWHSKNPYDLVITDIQMPKMSGTEFLNKLSLIDGKNPKSIVMTGRVNKRDLAGIYMDEFVCKPFNLFEFMDKIQEILGV